MKSKRIFVILAVVLVALFSGCIGEKEPSGEISMTDIDRMASEITENVNLNDPTVSISTKLLADDPMKEIELESVDVTTIQYVYNFSIIADRTMDDTLVVVGKDASGEIVYDRTEPIHLESGETQFFNVYIPVHKNDGQIIEDLTLTFKTLDEESIEVKTQIKTEKKPYAVSDKLKKRFASFGSDKDGKLSESEMQAWWDWVEGHVNRVPDEFGDYTKTPDETVNEGGGDCEDMAVLNAEFYKSHGYEVQILYVATDMIAAYKGKRDHALTRVKVDNEWMVVDNAAGSRLGDTIETSAIPHPVDFSLEHYLRIHPIKGEKIDPDAINTVGYDFNYDGKADLVSFDLNKDGVVDIYEFYKDGKKIQERHFDDGELIKTDYYDEDENLIYEGEPEHEEVSPMVVGSKSAYQLEVDRIWDERVKVAGKYEDIENKYPSSDHENLMNKESYPPTVSLPAAISDHENLMNKDKEKLDLAKREYNDELKITPPKGTEYLHNCYLNDLKYFIEYCEYEIKECQHTIKGFQYWDIARQFDYDDPQYDYYKQLGDEQMEIATEYGHKMQKSINQCQEYGDKIEAEFEKYHPTNSTEPVPRTST